MSTEQDLLASPKPVTPAGMTRNRLLKIRSSNSPQYEAILGAYANAPQMEGDSIVRTSNDIGDEGEIEEITGPLPASITNIRRPFRRGNEFFLWRPEQGEIIYVGPKPTISAPISLPTQPAENPAPHLMSGNTVANQSAPTDQVPFIRTLTPEDWAA